MTDGFYDNCTVRIFGGVGPEGEKVSQCHIAFLGSSPNATVALSQRDVGKRRYRLYDRLTSSTVTEADTNDGIQISCVGVSQMMVEEVGMSQGDAGVRWEITPHGCVSC